MGDRFEERPCGSGRAGGGSAGRAREGRRDGVQEGCGRAREGCVGGGQELMQGCGTGCRGWGPGFGRDAGV